MKNDVFQNFDDSVDISDFDQFEFIIRVKTNSPQVEKEVGSRL